MANLTLVLFVPLVATLLVGCQQARALAPASAGPPSAAQILTRVSHTGLADAHFKVHAAYTIGQVALDLQGDGVLVLRPTAAVRLTFQGRVAGRPTAIEAISVGGKTYQRVGGEAWKVQSGAASMTIPWAGAHSPTLVGEELLVGGKAWHLHAAGADSKPLELWVREKDGYPLRVSTTPGQGQAVTMEFDQFDTGATVAAP